MTNRDYEGLLDIARAQVKAQAREIAVLRLLLLWAALGFGVPADELVRRAGG